ncbi:uroporphyrin-III C-methyltransferase [Sporothrix curviconia]|uniref:precorrin-2 dehydrogenase n=1 Tax=Sporothrix curviconia TaxID=1260050 RepID=A0ABP0BW54_9PEZI
MAHHTSLLTAVDSRGHVHLVVGTSPLTAARCSQSLAVGASPILVAPEPTNKGELLPAALQVRVDAGEVRWLRETPAGFQETHLETLGRDEVDGFVDAVFVTSHDSSLAETVAAACRRRRIPVNVVDRPDLCSFALLSTHVEGPLQIGITTNGSGCKLAARIRREVASSLPAGLGEACARLGSLRRRIQEEDRRTSSRTAASATGTAGTAGITRATKAVPVLSEDDSYDQSAAFNQLVLPAANDDDDAETTKTRRMRWLAQMCEYWPLKRLAGLTDADVEALLEAYAAQGAALPLPQAEEGNRGPSELTAGRGRIILAGSGPGHPDLLTRAVHQAILSADVILADKLVPQGVLDLIPRRTEVAIARKFPGNADAAQEELIEQATAAALAGKTVLRLKQGDPFVYGRGGEEVLRLRAAGFRDGQSLFVLPGITSALSGPLFAGIPPTHRDAADQVLICTGTGKKGKPPQPPGYRVSRTAVFLMALHRITGLVAELTDYTAEEKAGVEDHQSQPKRTLWPAATPCAVIERTSCPDQKVIRTTLAHVAAAIEQEGSRPPGLLVVGRACGVLYAPVSETATSDGTSKLWSVEEGFAGLDLDSISPAGLASLA